MSKIKEKIEKISINNFDTEKSLEALKDGTRHVITVPYNGQPITVVVMILNSVQIKACGGPSILSIQNEKDSDKKLDITLDQMIEIKNMQESILDLALVSPTMKEITEYVGASSNIQKIKEDIKSIRDKTLSIEPVTAQDKKEQIKILKQLDAKEIMVSFLLPDDFMAFITAFVLQRDNTDIQRVSNDMLLEASILSDKTGKAPHEFLSGVFTEYQRTEIDKTALIIHSRFMEQKKIEKESSSKYIGGPKHKKG